MKPFKAVEGASEDADPYVMCVVWVKRCRAANERHDSIQALWASRCGARVETDGGESYICTCKY